jgi:hypothetical protein
MRGYIGAVASVVTAHIGICLGGGEGGGGHGGGDQDADKCGFHGTVPLVDRDGLDLWAGGTVAVPLVFTAGFPQRRPLAGPN